MRRTERVSQLNQASLIDWFGTISNIERLFNIKFHRENSEVNFSVLTLPSGEVTSQLHIFVFSYDPDHHMRDTEEYSHCKLEVLEGIRDERISS